MLSQLPNLLKERQILTANQVDALQTEADQNKRSFFKQIMQDKNLPNSRTLDIVCNLERMPYVDLSRLTLNSLPITALPERLLEQHKILPLSKNNNKLVVAIGNPDYESVLSQIRFHENDTTTSNLTITPVLCDPILLSKILGQVLTSVGGLDMYDGADDIDLEGMIIDDDDEESDKDDVDLDPKNVIVQYVNKILKDAVTQGASDIHIEPYENYARIRYRIDGILQSAGNPPLKLVRNIASRIKVLARLDISERRLPQDGRIKIRFSKSRTIDFRISTMPTIFGEKIVMRILDQGSTELNLDTLGMEPEQLAIYQEATRQPHGMILVTGPTGSGKTVTLYSALATLNNPDINISSVEDPVEIYAEGVNQVSINEKSGLTFARALRALLRQDPDIMMVGEIRDLETADISIKAAQTGHLVLSTLHTNDAPSAITRLLNMGVAPFNIASTVNLVIAQRLVRRLCKECKTPSDIQKPTLLNIGFTEEQLAHSTIFSAVGCASCTKGYSGRIGIYEMMPVSRQTAELVMLKATEAELTRQVRNENTLSLKQEGLKKVAAGITSIEEIERVTKA